MLDFSGRTVLVTGGTKGIGNAAALKFAALGARTVLTYHWGSVDDDEVRAAFAAAGAPEPLLIQADVANETDTKTLMAELKDRLDGVDVFVSNVAVAPHIKGVEDYDKRALLKSIEYSAWPLWSYPHAIAQTFGDYPRYIIGLSSDGPDSYLPGYDFVAYSKSVLEAMCRYLNYRLAEQGVRVNIVRSKLVLTESFRATFGEAFVEHARRMTGKVEPVTEDDLANVIMVLASGLMDGIAGQVIMVDHGIAFFDNASGLFERTGGLLADGPASTEGD